MIRRRLQRTVSSVIRQDSVCTGIPHTVSTLLICYKCCFPGNFCIMRKAFPKGFVYLAFLEVFLSDVEFLSKLTK